VAWPRRFGLGYAGVPKPLLRPSTQASTPYTHNGLGYRISWHHDVDADATVENTSDDPWYTFCYGERWRIVETYREGDTYPKEQFYYHNAGMSGMGGSSSIDSVLLRRRDVTNGWAGSADGIMEESTYYCQNWRSDVSVLLDASGDVMERIKYSTYGTPTSLPPGDTNSDAVANTTDSTRSRLGRWPPSTMFAATSTWMAW